MMSVPNIKELVLLGGGHSHVEVLRSWGMKPVAGVRLTLITRDMHTPYSGMLPGYVSGFYGFDDCHIDLCRLATFARARLIHAEATGLDTQSRRVLFASRPPVPYDVLSVDIGITPVASAVPGAAAHTTPVKPIDKFVARFDGLVQRVHASTTPLTVAVVGGGAGGVELALALAYRLRQERHGSGGVFTTSSKLSSPLQGEQDTVRLFCRGHILPEHPPAAAAALRRLCGERGMQLHEGAAVTAVEAGRLQTSDGAWHCFDEALWCTQAAAAGWLKQTGLPTDASGFLLINDCLQSAGGPAEVFAAGDVASSVSHPRPKAGVYAVRQGRPLAANLRRALTGQPLEPFVPQSQALALISTGDRYAVGTRGWLTFEGGWAWTLKDWIDRSFMDKYGTKLPFDNSMAMTSSASSGGSSSGDRGLWSLWSQSSSSAQQQQLPGAYQAAGLEAAELLTAASAMRCGGCGAKVGSSTLTRALRQVRRRQQQQQQKQSATTAVGQQHVPVLLGAGADDAAVLAAPPAGHVSVQTIDFFRSFWPDSYLLGAIAANHALGDCYAMGAAPSSALALAVLPFGPAARQEIELTDLLTGALEVLDEAGCELVGGHSSEGAELAAGFSVTGHVRPEQLMTKAGLQPGQLLILTKALGTGTILAAAMRGQAKGRWLQQCLQSMGASSAAAAVLLQRRGCVAATDVTGFGLLGHLVEMARASKVKVELQLSAIPALPGAIQCLSAGALSSLHPSNFRAAAAVIDNLSSCSSSYGAVGHLLTSDPRFLLLFDPQTAGGLLAGVPEAQCEACLAELRAAGYSDAAVVGRVVAGQLAQPPTGAGDSQAPFGAAGLEEEQDETPLVHLMTN